MNRRTAAGWVALAAGAALLFSALFAPEGLGSWILCPMRRWLGLSCPGCGLTRAFCAISHGRMHDAWELNPFGFFFYAVALALLVRPLLMQLAPELEARLMRSRWLGVFAITVMVGMLVFGIARVVHELSLRWA